MTPHPEYPVLDTSEVDTEGDGYLVETRCTSTLAWTCTLCGNSIPAGVPHDAWTWEDADILRAHPGCGAIRHEIDIDTWEQGTLAGRVRDWCDEHTPERGLAALSLLRSCLALDAAGLAVVNAAARMIEADTDPATDGDTDADPR